MPERIVKRHSKGCPARAGAAVRGAGAIALVVSVLVAATGSAAAPTSPTASGSRTSAVTLGSGEIEGASWSASLSRPHGPGKDQRGIDDRPCIGVTAQRIGRGGSSGACVFRPSLTPGSGALWATTAEPNLAESETAITAVAMVLAPVAAEVKATLVGGAVETIGLKRLTSAQARAAGLKRLRYTAFATAGPWCVARLESFDRDGRRLWRSADLSKKSCPPEG
jgi:hypothetical protein